MNCRKEEHENAKKKTTKENETIKTEIDFDEYEYDFCVRLWCA